MCIRDRVYTVNYYDDYSFIGKHGVPASLNYVTPPSGYGTRSESSKGLLTGTVTARMDATGVTGYDYAAFYYDERGRIIQSREMCIRDRYILIHGSMHIR